MGRYGSELPQVSDRIFLTDGGIETTMIYLEGMELPHFAAFTMMADDAGVEHLRRYYGRYAALARDNGLGFVFESPTWRASRDWAELLGYGAAELAAINRASIRLMAELRGRYETESSPMVISGCVGPRGDGYNPGRMMSADAAEAYHAEQIGAFAQTEADMITAITMNYAEEAIGISRAATRAGLPVAIAFTVETDGRLPTGQTLGSAIEMVDLATGHAPAYFMINCAHPTHFDGVLAGQADWLCRLRGVRANASSCSHAELDVAVALDDGDPVEFGRQYRELRRRVPHLTVLGGCCGTDHRHLEQICRWCVPAGAVPDAPTRSFATSAVAY